MADLLNVSMERYIQHQNEIMDILGGPQNILEFYLNSNALNMDQITALRVLLTANDDEKQSEEPKSHQTKSKSILTMEIPKTHSIKKQEVNQQIFLDTRDDLWHKICCIPNKTAEKTEKFI